VGGNVRAGRTVKEDIKLGGKSLLGSPVIDTERDFGQGQDGEGEVGSTSAHPRLGAKEEKKFHDQIFMGIKQLLQRRFTTMVKIVGPLPGARQIGKRNPILTRLLALAFKKIVEQGDEQPMVDMAGGAQFALLVNEKIPAQTGNRQSPLFRVAPIFAAMREKSSEATSCCNLLISCP